MMPNNHGNSQTQNHILYNKLHKHSLGVEHTGTDNEFEDVLEGLQSAKYWLTCLATAGDIQIRFQH